MIIKGEILLLSSVSHQGETEKNNQKKDQKNNQKKVAPETPVTRFRQEILVAKETRLEMTIDEYADNEENGEISLQETNLLKIPVISANSYKNGCLRRSAGRHLMDAIEMDVSDLTPNVAQIIFSGGPVASAGNEKSQKKVREKDFKEKLRRMLPHVSLFGTTVFTATMCPGRFIYFSKLYPFCMETVDVIGYKPLYSDRSYKEYTKFEYYTRKPALDSDQSDAETGGKYHWKIQVLSRGTLLGHEIVLSPHCTDIEKGALVVAINEFNARKPFVGGHTSKGLGKVRANYPDLPDSAPYTEYVNDNKAEIRDYLHYLNKEIAV